MDWQHLIMNGENLGEYAALLAAEGLLGHQHANSGWGTFDDDNMVGATASWRRSSSRSSCAARTTATNGERLGFDLYPYTEDAVAAVRRSVLQWRFIDDVAARIDEAALREAQQAQGRRARVRDRVRGARRVDVDVLVGVDVGTTAVKAIAIDADGDVLARAEEGYQLSTPHPGGPSRTPTTGGARPSESCRGSPRGAIGFSGQMHGLVALDAERAVLGPAILWNDQRTGAECAEIERRVGSSG